MINAGVRRVARTGQARPALATAPFTAEIETVAAAISKAAPSP